jgi:hypothetical protein
VIEALLDAKQAQKSTKDAAKPAQPVNKVATR